MRDAAITALEKVTTVGGERGYIHYSYSIPQQSGRCCQFRACRLDQVLFPPSLPPFLVESDCISVVCFSLIPFFRHTSRPDRRGFDGPGGRSDDQHGGEGRTAHMAQDVFGANSRGRGASDTAIVLQSYNT